MAGRVFAVLAAVFLVGAFALASLVAPDLPLGQALIMMNQKALSLLQVTIQQHVSAWVWNSVAVPLLLRPAWLLPASLGVVFAGAAMTLTSRPTHRGSRRRS